MRTSLLLLLVFSLACTPDPATKSADEHVGAAPGDTLMLTGVLVDARCYADQKPDSGDRAYYDEAQLRECGAESARSGFPAGLVVDRLGSDDVWILVTTPSALADYMTRTVRVRGAVRSEGVLIPLRIELKTGDEWAFIM